MYVYGEDVPKDYAKAVTLFQKACDGGDMGGCSSLGWMYGNGHGVAKDYAKAVTLYQKACKGGADDACKALQSP